MIFNPTVSLLGLEYYANLSMARSGSKYLCSTDQKTQFWNANLPPKAPCKGLVVCKILAAALAVIPNPIDTNYKPYLAGILDEIDKAISPSKNHYSNQTNRQS